MKSLDEESEPGQEQKQIMLGNLLIRVQIAEGSEMGRFKKMVMGLSLAFLNMSVGLKTPIL